ncbi:unannotated protein [freshwater metagenome]|uniref:Unannotated protein n=1 Tax=freshwater metagenome TaxID=449393 RepID=A0A6J7N0J4_9ZZZZ
MTGSSEVAAESFDELLHPDRTSAIAIALAIISFFRIDPPRMEYCYVLCRKCCHERPTIGGTNLRVSLVGARRKSKSHPSSG